MDGRKFVSGFMAGFASIGRAMTSLSIVPEQRSIDDIQDDLTRRYGIKFDDTRGLKSDWDAIGNDMKRVLNSIQNKKVGL